MIIYVFSFLIIKSENFFAEPKRKSLSKVQLKQKIGERYEIFLRQTSKIAEINALIQQEIYNHLYKLLGDDKDSILKNFKMDELNNYYENLIKITEQNEKELSHLMHSLNGLKSNFQPVKSISVQKK